MSKKQRNSCVSFLEKAKLKYKEDLNIADVTGNKKIWNVNNVNKEEIASLINTLNPKKLL